MLDNRNRRTIRQRIAAWLFFWMVMNVISKRRPDQVLGAERPQGPYMLRWWLTPWRGWFESIPEEQRTWWQRVLKEACKRTLPNLYLHKFVGDDDDRALHDHPSAAGFFVLANARKDITIDYGGIQHVRVYRAGDVGFYGPFFTHRVELFGPKTNRVPCLTLFLFLPKLREWGFHCPDKGWVHWKVFTARNGNETGRGCA